MAEDANDDRHPKNLPGPFWVTNGECITCRAPEAEAPDLIGFDNETRHCYFKKQPSTQDEIDRAIKAVWVSCCGAVKYQDDDPVVQSRISALIQEMAESPPSSGRNRWWKFW